LHCKPDFRNDLIVCVFDAFFFEDIFIACIRVLLYERVHTFVRERERECVCVCGRTGTYISIYLYIYISIYSIMALVMLY
jgi:hypothetical protein